MESLKYIRHSLFLSAAIMATNAASNAFPSKFIHIASIYKTQTDFPVSIQRDVGGRTSALSHNTSMNTVHKEPMLTTITHRKVFLTKFELRQMVDLVYTSVNKLLGDLDWVQ